MNNFTYVRPSSIEEALREHGGRHGTVYLAGGTNLVDHLKLGVEAPERLVDVRRIGLDSIRTGQDGALIIGAGATNSAVARDERVRASYPALSKALLSGASPQLRNVATVGGNLLQRTRCSYFRDGISACNKRLPTSGCSAIDGFNRSHAVLGTSGRCIATHPSDMAVALSAYDAVIHTRGVRGERRIPIGEFYVAYGDDPALENVLEAGELILEVELASVPWFETGAYVKARERSSFEFALASAAASVDLADGIVRECRIALGGVATKPWRAHRAEDALRGLPTHDSSFRKAAEAEMAAANPRKDNGFKIELACRVMVQALREAAGGKA